jgi:hypothetical protein
MSASMTGSGLWPSARSRDGGLDAVPVPGLTARLWLCGKHVVGADPEAVVERVGVPVLVVCLTERHELFDRYPDYVAWLDRYEGTRSRWFPIPDLHAPDLDALTTFVDQLAAELRGGRDVVVHCAAGIGRSGTVAVCTLMRLGVAEAEARRTVAHHRPMAGPEVGAQHELVAAFAAGLTGPT